MPGELLAWWRKAVSEAQHESDIHFLRMPPLVTRVHCCTNVTPSHHTPHRVGRPGLRQPVTPSLKRAYVFTQHLILSGFQKRFIFSVCPWGRHPQYVHSQVFSVHFPNSKHCFIHKFPIALTLCFPPIALGHSLLTHPSVPHCICHLLTFGFLLHLTGAA